MTASWDVKNARRDLNSNQFIAPENGKHISYFKNGQIFESGFYKDGKKDGKWTTWYENGQKKLEGSCKEDKDDGFQVIWDENGKKIWEGTIKMGDVIDDEGFPYSMFDDLNPDKEYSA